MRIKDSVFRNNTSCNLVESVYSLEKHVTSIFKAKDGEIIFFLDMSANLASYME